VIGLDRAAATELFSVRCEGGVPNRAYFATFDCGGRSFPFVKRLELNATSDYNAGAFSASVFGWRFHSGQLDLKVCPI
jgi:hypothetical protein